MAALSPRWLGARNGISGLWSICQKDLFVFSVQTMRRTNYASEYSFCPVSFVLPSQRLQWEAATSPPLLPSSSSYSYPLSSSSSSSSSPMWIVKPPNDSCGVGISVHRSAHSLSSAALSLISVGSNAVVSTYISSPLLSFSRHKFDMRLYAMLLCTPDGGMRAFLYDDGLARFCAMEYGDGENVEETYRHLTNYSLNVGAEGFKESVGGGGGGGGEGPAADASSSYSSYYSSFFSLNRPSSSSIPSLDDETKRSSQSPPSDGGLDAHKWSVKRVIHDLPLTADVLGKASVILSRTVALAANTVRERTRERTKTEGEGARERSFELVGLDVMLDKDYKMWLLEVQHGPSMDKSSELDERIKGKLMRDVEALLAALGGPEKVQTEGGDDDDKAAGPEAPCPAGWRECLWDQSESAILEAKGHEDVDRDLRKVAHDKIDDLAYEVSLLKGICTDMPE